MTDQVYIVDKDGIERPVVALTLKQMHQVTQVPMDRLRSMLDTGTITRLAETPRSRPLIPVKYVHAIANGEL